MKYEGRFRTLKEEMNQGGNKTNNDAIQEE